jgi:F-box protein 9
MQRQGTADGVPQEESQELSRFRQEWLAELSARRSSVSAADAPSNLPGPTHQSSQAHPSTSTTVAQKPAVPTVSLPSIQASAVLSDVQASALEKYRQAIQHEQRGQLDDALTLYRHAFRIVCIPRP